MILGLTGHYCSGKSFVEKIIVKNFNILVIDVDKIGHIALKEKKDDIISQFGSKILINENDENSEIDRKKLGNIVFSNEYELRKLNKIVHPFMRDYVTKIISENNNKNILINAALLFDMNLDKFCHKIIVIKSNILNTIIRGIKRDKRSVFQIIKIINNQSLQKYLNQNLKNDDIIIVKNNSNTNSLSKKILKLLTEIINGR